MSIEVMKQALEVLSLELPMGSHLELKNSLRTAIEQEPVTWWHEPGAQMNYRKWQGLTDEEREQFRQWAHPDIIEAIELKLQQRNT